MNVVPLPFAIWGACVGFEMRRVFDVKTAHVIAQRRLPPVVRGHLTGILSGVVSAENQHSRSWKFAFRDERVTKGDCKRIVVVHEKYSSENDAVRADFIDGCDVLEPSGGERLSRIPELPAYRPAGTAYRLELLAGTDRKPRWIVHTLPNRIWNETSDSIR